MRILIACMPKSGSTFPGSLIGGLPNFEMVPWVPAFGRREQELSEAHLASYDGRLNQVSQHHVRASSYTIDLVNKYRISTPVLVRNIFDCAVSLANHIERESFEFPCAYFDEHIFDISYEHRLSAVVALAIPWYIHFYVSWWNTAPEKVITYEDVVLGGRDAHMHFLRSVGLDPSPEEYEAALSYADLINERLNVGVSGRGRETLDETDVDNILKLCRYYPHVDFTPIGVTPDLLARHG